MIFTKKLQCMTGSEPDAEKLYVELMSDTYKMFGHADMSVEDYFWISAVIISFAKNNFGISELTMRQDDEFTFADSILIGIHHVENVVVSYPFIFV